MKVKVHVASAFSKDNKGGNKAGIVLFEQSLTTTQKKSIAKQLGYAETAFISKSERADYKFEYFTPKDEVALCGHATIGAFTALGYLKKLSKTQYTIETKSGILAINIEDDLTFMEQAKPIYYDVITPEKFVECFNIEHLDNKYPIQIASTGLKDILIPIKEERNLNTLQPNFEKIKEISEYYDVVGMHLYTFKDDRIICRNFAPLYDIDEESATGTSNGALACHLYENLHLHKDTYIFEQGHSLKLPSEILVKLVTNNNDEVEKVYVGGRGYYCENKYLNVE